MDPAAAAASTSETKLGVEDDAGAAALGAPAPGFAGLLGFRWGEEEEGGSEGEDASGGSILTDLTEPASGTTSTSIPRVAGLERLIRARKLILVLDLDHTLLNSTRLRDLSASERNNGFTQHTGDDPGMGLFRLESPLGMLTKLRPFVRGFLQETSAMFEMHVYTLGKQHYAREVAKLLDPEGAYFGARVISSAESTRRDKKSLDVVVPVEERHAVVILDDRERVWEEHKENLILVERYLYFASVCRDFGYGDVTNSLAEAKRDEGEQDGAMAVMLGVLRRVHRGFFDSVLEGCFSDVRVVIRELRREVLRGCTVAFSRVIPLEARAKDHRAWRKAERLGAVCAADVGSEVTHVVANDAGTEKARWALKNGKFLVNPKWIDAANRRWSRQDEQEFPVVAGGRAR